MQSKVVYRCPGSCHGVSPVAKNCGAPTCTDYDQPLHAVMQCHACTETFSKDGKAHACSMCEPA